MLKKLAPLALALLAPISAQACRYTVDVFGTGDSTWYRDVVTEKFCQKFPFGKYKLVVFNYKIPYPEETFGTAVAYVSPVMADKGANKPITARFYVAKRGQDSERFSLIKTASIAAVQDLMDEVAPDEAPAQVNNVSRVPMPAAPRYEATSRVAQPEAPAALPLPGQLGYKTTFPEAAKMTGSGGVPY